jgi:hypothetical protein
MSNERQRFSIRKLSIGAASVLLGTTLFLTNGGVAHADKLSQGDQTVKTEETASESNTSATGDVKQTEENKQQVETGQGKKEDKQEVEQDNKQNSVGDAAGSTNENTNTSETQGNTGKKKLYNFMCNQLEEGLYGSYFLNLPTRDKAGRSRIPLRRGKPNHKEIID